MVNLCLIGYGRMGKTIETLAPSMGCKIQYIIKGDEKWDIEQLKNCDVAIDFSIPNSAYSNIKRCIELNIPIVSGTTGWLDKLDDIKKELQKNTNSAFLYGSNFSLGMNVFFILNKQLASLMQPLDYSLSIKEIHHTKKLDAPSGTAITLAEDLLQIHKDKKSWSLDKENESSLHIEAIREPDVPGTHIIHYENEIDSIEISHIAKSRKGFAEGAILSAKWLIGKKGYYSIQDFVAELLSLSL